MKTSSNMRPINIFYGHIAVGLFFTLLSVWGTTQYVAYALGYQAQLGAPLVVVKGYPIYEPWAWFFWAYYFEHYAPWVFSRASWITYGCFFAMFFVMILLAARRAKKKKNSGAYGTARWAEEKELQKAGLLSNRGVVMAQTNDAKYHSEVDDEDNVKWVMDKYGKNLICHNGQEHIFCFAPTGSGKDVGINIPTLVNWTGSALIYDIKKELWASTAGWRKKFSHCLRFEPTAIDNHVRFNPLMEIRKGDYEVRDAQNIADILVDPEGAKERKDHWEKTGRILFVGSILHILYAEKEKSLTGLINFLSNPDRDIYATLNDMLQTKHLGDRPHPVVAGCARAMLNKSGNELSGVVSTAISFLDLYNDPIIAKNTSVSDFKIDDLMNAEKPVSLYLVVPPSDIDRTKPFIRLMLNQIGRRLTEKMEFGNSAKTSSKVRAWFSKFLKIKVLKTSKKGVYKNRLLMVLNEFPSLGRLDFFETELAYLRGYGIKCLIIAQSLNQIDKAYGPNNSILDNSHVRLTYGSLDDRTAKRISELLGQATEHRRQMNFAGNRLAPWLGHIMASEQESPRQLLTPGEVLQLPGDDIIVMAGGSYPYRAKKLMYFQDKRFDGRVWLPPPDSEKDQRAELITPGELINDWKGMVIKAEPDKTSKRNKKAARPGEYKGDWESFFDESEVSHAKLDDESSEGRNADPGSNEAEQEKNLQKAEVAQRSESKIDDEDKERLKTDKEHADEDMRKSQEEYRRIQQLQRRSRTIEMGRDFGGGDLPL